MSEMRLEPSEPTPPPFKHSPTEPNPSQGSLAAGIGLAWLIVVGGHLVLYALTAFVAQINPAAGFFTFPLWILPEATVLIVGLKMSRSRTRSGVFLGLASIFAVYLLLVAACFGLVISSWGH